MRKHLLFYFSAIALCVALGFIGRTLYVRAHVDFQAHYKAIVKELSSERYQGRGYAADGVREAGGYIAFEFGRSGADEVSMQAFTLDINTFPGKMEASVDGRQQRSLSLRCPRRSLHFLRERAGGCLQILSYPRG